mmetsp:Transcript_15357/g.23354  ORF Transcript_15357/g.23354 Transcript_15357/m.23354 type:complete len:496 (-) Transcript_15357:252-1739(-)
MRAPTSVHILAGFVAVSSLIFYQFPWMLILLLQCIAAIITLCVIVWCVIQTLDILNFFSPKTEIQSMSSKQKRTQTTPRTECEKEALRDSSYPPYPAGWYSLCWSDEVKNGEVIQRDALGKSYAIFRGDSNGEIGVLDAYCPHLGANLAVGGKVCDDTLQCPFHKWRFDKDGTCTHIPYLQENAKIPRNAKVSSYPCVEYHGMVCVWYDGSSASPERGRLPWYHLPIQAELANDSNYRYFGRRDYGLINMHIHEFAENAADWKHFEPIHTTLMIPFSRTKVPLIDEWLRIHHTPATYIGGGSGRDSMAIQQNAYGPDNKHFLYFINNAYLTWNGVKIPNTEAHAVVSFFGPSGVVLFKFCVPSFPNAYIFLFQTHLPEERMQLRVRFHWYAHQSLPRLFVWYVVGNWLAQWTNDIEIWENKLHLSKPCLVKGDGPILKVRRWLKQFYPDTKQQQQRKKNDDNESSAINEQEQTVQAAAGDHNNNSDNKNNMELAW